MKIKVLSRNPDVYLRETKKDINKTEREYTQALNAIKLERVFAKPLVGVLSGHRDGVFCMNRHPCVLSWFLSGSCDGEIRIWNLNTKDSFQTLQAHNGFVRCITLPQSANYFISCGDDKTIKFWSMQSLADVKDLKPHNMIVYESMIHGCDHHFSEGLYATSGHEINLWDLNRSEPIKSYFSTNETSNAIKFNPIEHDILASAASDRSIALYDIRKPTHIRKLTLKMRTNALSWNPIESYTLTLANEDYNAYTFDTRFMNRPKFIHSDHTGAVLDIDYSPCGTEFVTGSFDKTLRIFEAAKGRSREVYYTQRMQRIFCVKWSADNKYIYSGSDETNIRIWKARAWEKIGIVKTRERNAFNYNAKLKEKYANHPEIARINRHRHIPKPLFKAKRELLDIKQAQIKKETNVIKNKSKKMTRKAEKQKVIVAINDD